MKLSGMLNGSDICFLREMAGRDLEGNFTDGKLTSLDLYDAQIVEGGSYYYIDRNIYPVQYYFTKVNQFTTYLFKGCLLENMVLPKGVRSISSSFMECGSLVSVKMPEGVRVIDDKAFKGCSNLRMIDIPKTVEIIGPMAFEDCNSLSSLDLPESVRELGSSAFNGCSSLKSFNVPEKVTCIELFTFAGCSNLESVSLPKNLTLIDMYAFSRCGSLKELYCYAPVPPVLSANSGLTVGGMVYVPYGSAKRYRLADEWSMYADYIVEMKEKGE